MTGIVILTYNTWDVTEKCVNSILSSPIETSYKIYLVDNHSETLPTEGIKKVVKENGNITYFRAKENRNFIGLGLCYCWRRYIWKGNGTLVR